MYQLLIIPNHCNTIFCFIFVRLKVIWYFCSRVGNGLLIPISQTVRANDNIVGVVGLDIEAAELLEDLAYSQHTPETYSFVMLRCGLVLFHPNLPTPEQWSSMQLLHVQDLEADEQMHDLLRNIITMPSGNYISSKIHFF